MWIAFLIGGAAAGIAGVTEVAGPIGNLNDRWTPGYGFTAIIVAALGRLNAVGIVLASLLMALLYLGGEAAQISMQLPKAISQVFQGLLLLFLLGCDVLVGYRVARRASRAAPAPAAGCTRPTRWPRPSRRSAWRFPTARRCRRSTRASVRRSTSRPRYWNWLGWRSFASTGRINDFGDDRFRFSRVFEKKRFKPFSNSTFDNASDFARDQFVLRLR